MANTSSTTTPVHTWAVFWSMNGVYPHTLNLMCYSFLNDILTPAGIITTSKLRDKIYDCDQYDTKTLETIVKSFKGLDYSGLDTTYKNNIDLALTSMQTLLFHLKKEVKTN